ncbi:MAG TPA: hypothetical protein VFX41_03635 [Actinomycetales bacterium]|nr:hypothetical protein [Actinomycetales bacterium]
MTHLVMTIDQRRSRRGPDLVEDLLERLHDRELGKDVVLPFERTAGDEVQGLLSSPQAVVDLALLLAESRAWSIGIGVGEVRQPLPSSTRAAGGPAFENARDAVERAKSVAEGIAVTGPEPVSAGDAEAVLQMLAAVILRRSEAGRQTVDLARTGLRQHEAAERLGISKQAVSQRLQTAFWNHERRVRPVAARLLDRASASDGSDRSSPSP